MSTTTTLNLTREERALLREAVEFEIEHTHDMIREMPDETDDQREDIRVQQIREDRLTDLYLKLAPGAGYRSDVGSRSLEEEIA